LRTSLPAKVLEPQIRHEIQSIDPGLPAFNVSSMKPDLGKDVVNPSRYVYKTKADVVNLIQQAVADGSNLIQQQGDAGLDKTTKFPFGNRLVHNSYNWMFVIEDSGEHYGQLMVYYRANNMVPPESRPR
jgi:hypothetical protein